MFRMPAFFMGLTLCFSAMAQQTIKGRVVNDANNTPVPGSSVFISNTSKGTTADKNGYFELDNVPPGRHELVISSIGFETNVFSFSDKDLPLQLKIELRVKVKEMENVTIEPSVEEGWEKWGRTFMENFVGTTRESEHCRIKNEKAIRFRYYKKSNRVIAYCDEPVLLENKALGYLVSYQLENFEVNFNERSTSYMGYPLFSELDKNSPKTRWIKAREKAYHGSVMHFMRSLYNDRLAEEGFVVQRMIMEPNYEKQRVKKIHNASGSMQHMNAGTIILNAPKLPADSADYFRQVLRQPDYRHIILPPLLTADSLIISSEGEYKYIHFPDYIHVTYKNEKEDELFLRTQLRTDKPAFQRSYVMLAEGEVVAVDKTGNYYNPQHFISAAYWGWDEKMANSLPLDYMPGEK